MNHQRDLPIPSIISPLKEHNASKEDIAVQRRRLQIIKKGLLYRVSQSGVFRSDYWTVNLCLFPSIVSYPREFQNHPIIFIPLGVAAVCMFCDTSSSSHHSLTLCYVLYDYPLFLLEIETQDNKLRWGRSSTSTRTHDTLRHKARQGGSCISCRFLSQKY